MGRVNQLLILFFMFVTISAPIHAESPNWTSKIKNTWQKLKWPHDRTQDEVKLLPFGQELKLNYFLQRLHDENGVQVYFKLIPSLQGKELEAQAQETLAEIIQEDSGGRYLLFFLSLSDRKFLILPNPTLRSEVSEEQLGDWVQQLVPNLKRQNYTKAIEDFLQTILYSFAPQSQNKVPELNLNKSYNLNSLLFFAVGFLVIFMLGHKLRKTPRIIEKDASLVRKKTTNLTYFW